MMKIRKQLSGAAAAALATMAAQPCLASMDSGRFADVATRPAAFAGASIRLDLGGRAAAKPSARLQLGMTQNPAYRTAATSAQPLRVSGLEIGAAKTGTPQLYFGGREMKELKTQAGLNSSSGTILLVVGAVAAAALLVAVAASSGNSDDCEADDWFC